MKIPNSWNEVTVKDFIELSKVKVSNDIHGLVDILRVFNPDVESLTMPQITSLAAHLNFMDTLPQQSTKTALKPKKEHTYNDFVSLVNLNDELINSLPDVYKNIFETNLSKEEFLNLPITDVYHGFFLLRKTLTKRLKRLIRLEQKRVNQLKMKVA